MDAKSEKVELTDLDLKKFCQRKGYRYPGILYLDTLKHGQIGFVYTGSEANRYNKGHTHHWMLLINNKLFDSYGNYNNTFSTPDPLIYFVNKSRLQAFDSCVCGEYCCSFYDFYNQSGGCDVNDYKNTFELGLDQDRNDANILKWFKSQKTT
jgi:hypothetical protein